MKDEVYKLQIENILDNEVVIVSTPKVLLKEINQEQIIKKYFEDLIQEFIQTITKEISFSDLNILHNNLSNITIHQKMEKNKRIKNFKKCIFNLSFTMGYYKFQDNNIYIISFLEHHLYQKIIKIFADFKEKKSYKKIIKGILFHELLHASTTIYIDKFNYFSGFCQGNSYYKQIGNGINEGYTENLLEKFFPNDVLLDCMYNYEKSIAKLTEEIVGFDKMSKYYFNADLYSFVSELAKYSSIEKAGNFILNLDQVIKIQKSNLDILEKEYSLQELSDRINTFLIKTYTKKIEEENLPSTNIEIFIDTLVKSTEKYLIKNNDIQILEHNQSKRRIYVKEK